MSATHIPPPGNRVTVLCHLSQRSMAVSHGAPLYYAAPKHTRVSVVVFCCMHTDLSHIKLIFFVPLAHLPAFKSSGRWERSSSPSGPVGSFVSDRIHRAHEVYHNWLSALTSLRTTARRGQTSSTPTSYRVGLVPQDQTKGMTVTVTEMKRVRATAGRNVRQTRAV